MGKKKGVLGKGLGKILGEVAKAYERELPSKEEIIELDIDSIRSNPYQPRKMFDKNSLYELAESIKEHGLLQPVIVIEDVEGFMLIAGERRLKASKIAGLKKIKAIVAKIEKSKYREFALIENIQREELNPLDLAQSYQELIQDYGITHEELAKVLKKSRASITNTLRLLNLSPYAKQALCDGKISAGHAKILVTFSPTEQKKLIDEVVQKRLSVRDLERIIKSKKVTLSLEKTPPKLNLIPIKKRLQECDISCNIHQNRITIEFSSQEEVDRFLQFFSQF
ncbi:MAG: ParB/RepB/Spo0J family partition protein [Epsilonproteobacteria bacterium]|nr:ParB/RepB/Spo0J family partition protein [Campylobacterota bacterium]